MAEKAPPQTKTLSGKGSKHPIKKSVSQTGMPVMIETSTLKGAPAKLQVEMLPYGFCKANVDELGFQDWTERYSGSIKNMLDVLKKTDCSDVQVLCTLINSPPQIIKTSPGIRH